MNKKIFQIGFNKTGTGSIYQFLLDNDIKSVHWAGGKISRIMHLNDLNGDPLLKGLEEYQGFTDMEHNLKDGGFFYASERYFKELDKQYPGSLFIFNYRNIDKWILSRSKHSNGMYLLNAMIKDGLDRDEIFSQWRQEYKTHMQNVEDYFREKDNCLLLNIEDTNNELLGEFLRKHGLSIRSMSLGHHHKTEVKDTAPNFV